MHSQSSNVSAVPSLAVVDFDAGFFVGVERPRQADTELRRLRYLPERLCPSGITQELPLNSICQEDVRRAVCPREK